MRYLCASIVAMLVLAATSATFAGIPECPPQQTAKLTADDGASDDLFGYSVATSDGVAVIGAYGDDDDGTNSGSAYVYEQQADGTWSQTAKLTADDGAQLDYFGYSVATSGGVAVIGARYDEDWSGSAYVFEQQADGTWQQTVKLTADDGIFGDFFGYSVATSGGVTVIGAYGDDGFAGSAYVFEQQADGTWQQIPQFWADDWALGDKFGYSVATSGGVAVIGAPYDDDNNNNSGSAYVFEQQAAGTWSQTAKLTADDGAVDDFFGYSVATSGGVAVIGAYGDGFGSAYVYEQQGDGTWSQTAKLTADDGAQLDFFGYSVATSGGVAVIGAYSDDNNDNNSGSAYVYEQQGDGTWQQVAKLTADDGASTDNFGISVATSDGVAVIGARHDDDNGSNSGSAYVYKLTGADCNNNGICDADDLLDGTSADCNDNGIPDSCDIANGGDSNGDGIVDDCECSADVSGPKGPGFPDGVVNIDDLLTVLGYWGSDIQEGDINGDGIVNIDDMLLILGSFGPCP